MSSRKRIKREEDQLSTYREGGVTNEEEKYSLGNEIPVKRGSLLLKKLDNPTCVLENRDTEEQMNYQELEEGGDRKEVKEGRDRKEIKEGGDRKEVKEGGDRKEVKEGGDRKEVKEGGDRKEVKEGGDRKEVKEGRDRKEVKEGGDKREIPSEEGSSARREKVRETEDLTCTLEDGDHTCVLENKAYTETDESDSIKNEAGDTSQQLSSPQE